MTQDTKWKLMPFPPTYQMLAQALVNCPVFGLSINAMPIIYEAMWDAAPTPPEQEPTSMEPAKGITYFNEMAAELAEGKE